MPQLPMVLSHVLEASPRFIRAAIEANIAPNLVRILRKTTKARGSTRNRTAEIPKGHEAPVSCLKQMLKYDMENARTLWKPAVDAGIVPLFIDLLTLGHEPMTIEVTSAAGFLLTPVPQGEAALWDGGLLRALAGLLTADSPIVLAGALDVLFNVGWVHPELIVDCRTWGIEHSVQRLAVHADPTVAGIAKMVNNFFFHGHQFPEVRPIPSIFVMLLVSPPLLPHKCAFNLHARARLCVCDCTRRRPAEKFWGRIPCIQDYVVGNDRLSSLLWPGLAMLHNMVA
jgi:hypothetical protein